MITAPVVGFPRIMARLGDGPELEVHRGPFTEAEYLELTENMRAPGSPWSQVWVERAGDPLPGSKPRVSGFAHVIHRRADRVYLTRDEVQAMRRVGEPVTPFNPPSPAIYNLPAPVTP